MSNTDPRSRRYPETHAPLESIMLVSICIEPVLPTSYTTMIPLVSMHMYKTPIVMQKTPMFFKMQKNIHCLTSNPTPQCRTNQTMLNNYSFR